MNQLSFDDTPEIASGNITHEDFKTLLRKTGELLEDYSDEKYKSRHFRLESDSKLAAASLCIESYVFAKLRFLKSRRHVEFYVKKDVIPENIDLDFENIGKVLVDSARTIINDIDNNFYDILREITAKADNIYQCEKFGCCHRYVECSDALRCVKTDLFAGKGCYYRKNLESGRVFYGKNRNFEGVV